jgi:T4 RnlA family RNA ligase
MEVLTYLNSFCCNKEAIDKIKEEYSIIVKEYDNGFYVLNYSQIDSPKNIPITNECRGLILEYTRGQFKVVSRSFDRFFNHGECPETQEHLDFSLAQIFDKADGSLIKIYNHNGHWYCSTRGTAFAESDCNGFTEFRELVYKALCVYNLQEFNDLCNMCLDSRLTYIFELTCRENRVVKHYKGYTLWYLNARENSTGNYYHKWGWETCQHLNVSPLRTFKFDTVEHCLESSKELKDLDEGYVVYQDGIPVCKIKSPTYIAVHRIRGEGTPSPKRIMQLLLMNEQDEYLTYFPEDKELFHEYQKSLYSLEGMMSFNWSLYAPIEEQKEFALKVKDFIYSACFFKARQLDSWEKMVHPLDVFKDQPENYKLKVLEAFHKERIKRKQQLL